jgi:hypothetical protein
MKRWAQKELATADQRLGMGVAVLTDRALGKVEMEIGIEKEE